jgi:predicted SAM-dependent methyltransferase
MLKLDIGCGASKKEGFIGIDILPLKGVDIVHDLNLLPYPFEDNTVDEIWMDQVLEHLLNPLEVVNELYRISKNGTRITIGVPYFRSFYATIDPTHRNFFGTNWFNYFDPNHMLCQKYQYSKSRFKVNKIEFEREFKNNIGYFRKRFIKLAENHPWFYEEKLSHLIPIHSLTFYLTVMK